MSGTTDTPTKAKCSWCGSAFAKTQPNKMFCRRDCTTAFANWCASRGKVLMPIALAWRTSRGRKGVGADAMHEMVRFLDQCAAELAGQGAPPAARHYAATRANSSGVTHWNDFDRHRPSRS